MGTRCIGADWKGPVALGRRPKVPLPTTEPRRKARETVFFDIRAGQRPKEEQSLTDLDSLGFSVIAFMLAMIAFWSLK